MRLPRDVSGENLARALRISGYRVTRQTGSHLRLTTLEGGEHDLTIPQHGPLRVGTRSAILADAVHHFEFELTREDLPDRLGQAER